MLPESRLAGNGLADAAVANRSRQFHANLVFTVTPPAGATSGFNFTAAARLLTGGGSYADVLLTGSAAVGNQQQGPVITALRFAVDKRKTGGFTPEVEEGGPVPLPIGPDGSPGWLLPSKQLTLDVFVDHSVVEAYAMDGLGRVTSRVYPADESAAWGLAAYGSAAPGGTLGLASADAWAMDNAWTGQPPLC